MQVLIKNNARPILVMAFTNHAVDHLVRGVLDEKITSKIVRLGARSADEEIASRSLESLERLEGQSRLRPALGRTYGEIKDLEKEMSELMNRITSPKVPSQKVMEMLEFMFTDQWECLESPPLWIYELYREALYEGQDWEVVGGEGHAVKTTFDFWFHGYDLQFLADPVEVSTPAQPLSQSETSNRYNLLARDSGSGPSASQIPGQYHDMVDHDNRNDEADIAKGFEELRLSSAESWMHQLQAQASTSAGTSQATPTSASPPSDQHAPDPDPSPPSKTFKRDEFLSRFGVIRPTIPTSNRPLEELESQLALWTLSQSERQTLGNHWKMRTRLQNYEIEREEFERLRKMHQDAQERHNDLKDEVIYFFSFLNIYVIYTLLIGVSCMLVTSRNST